MIKKIFRIIQRGKIVVNLQQKQANLRITMVKLKKIRKSKSQLLLRRLKIVLHQAWWRLLEAMDSASWLDSQIYLNSSKRWKREEICWRGMNSQLMLKIWPLTRLQRLTKRKKNSCQRNHLMTSISAHWSSCLTSWLPFTLLLSLFSTWSRSRNTGVHKVRLRTNSLKWFAKSSRQIKYSPAAIPYSFCSTSTKMLKIRMIC